MTRSQQQIYDKLFETARKRPLNLLEKSKLNWLGKLKVEHLKAQKK